MLFTMRQAERQLAGFSRKGREGAREAILDAVEALAASKYWNHARMVIRFAFTGGGRFALPQEFTQIVRAAVSGTPVPVRGTEYNFLYGGPGDLDAVPAGYAPVNGLVDEGFAPPVALTPSYDHRMAASMPAAFAGGTVRVFMQSGVSVTLPVLSDEAVEDAEDWDSIGAAEILAEHGEVMRVILRGNDWPAGWLTFWHGLPSASPAESRGHRVHTSVRAPLLRHYFLPGSSADETYSILAEVRPALLRATGDDDVVQVPSLMPVQYMMQAQCKFDEGEVDAGAKLHELAVGSLMQLDETLDRKQTTVVFNSTYEASAGQDSLGYANI